MSEPYDKALIAKAKAIRRKGSRSPCNEGVYAA